MIWDNNAYVLITVTPHELEDVTAGRQVECLFNNLFWLTLKKQRMFCITGPLGGGGGGDLLVAGGLSLQRASYVGNASLSCYEIILLLLHIES